MRFQLALFAFALVLVSTTYITAQNVKICEPKSVFMDDCNRCRCSDDGLDKSCTRIMCVKKPGSEEGRRTRRDYEGDSTCVPGEAFNISCRLCVCTETGKKEDASCTLNLCPDDLDLITGGVDGPKTCEPGSVFYDDCNSCYCPDSGLADEASCTIMACGD